MMIARERVALFKGLAFISNRNRLGENSHMPVPSIATAAVQPEFKDDSTLAPSYPTVTNGIVGADREAPIIYGFNPMTPLLTRCFSGRVRNLEDMRPERERRIL